jgi:hypothetical protein
MDGVTEGANLVTGISSQAKTVAKCDYSPNQLGKVGH